MTDLKELELKIEKLTKEKEYYKNILIQNNIKFIPFENMNSVKLTSSDKINIYMDYFKGRIDVFATRWEKSEKSGYSPVCNNKFVYGKCNLIKYKCKDCPNQVYKKLTEEDIIKHIKGEITIGIYPMLDDDTCNFIVIDFDEEDYKEAAMAFAKECKNYDLDYLIEISRSGNGIHVWLFFENNYLSLKARKIVSSLLTTAMLKFGKITFSSYDRMFPSQDKLLKNGIGNLIALPLNGKKDTNTTVFVNDEFIPYDNQFEKLRNTKKISTLYLDAIFKKINETNENGLFGEETKKYSLSNNDFASLITIEIEKEIKFVKKELSNNAIKHLMRISSFLNKKYYENQAKRLSVYGIPRVISLYKVDNDYLYLPRGCFEQVFNILNKLNVRYIVNDKRIANEKIDINFNGELKKEQINGLNQLLNKENGMFVASTGFGKTVVALALIAKLQLNTLILVNNKNLCEQWIERINKFLVLNYETNQKYKVGKIDGANKKK